MARASHIQPVSAVSAASEFPASSGSSSAPFCKSPRKTNPAGGGNAAEKIAPFPRVKVPPVADYAARCAALIRETFPAPSQHQTCLAAARATGACPDTFDRVLSGITKSPDARLMLVVMAIRATRDPRPFNLGNGFAVRVTMETRA